MSSVYFLKPRAAIDTLCDPALVTVFSSKETWLAETGVLISTAQPPSTAEQILVELMNVTLTL